MRSLEKEVTKQVQYYDKKIDVWIAASLSLLAMTDKEK